MAEGKWEKSDLSVGSMVADYLLDPTILLDPDAGDPHEWFPRWPHWMKT